MKFFANFSTWRLAPEFFRIFIIVRALGCPRLRCNRLRRCANSCSSSVLRRPPSLASSCPSSPTSSSSDSARLSGSTSSSPAMSTWICPTGLAWS
eukprot:529533-Pyramimonas_sp.AAC.1